MAGVLLAASSCLSSCAALQSKGPSVGWLYGTTIAFRDPTPSPGLMPSTILRSVVSRASQASPHGTRDQEEYKELTEEQKKKLKPKFLAVVLDIEGTTTPISFVTEALFPYARDNVRSHLCSTYDTEETKADIDLLRQQAEQDVKDGVIGIRIIPSSGNSRDEIILAVEANVAAMIKADRKVFALKELQGHIWRSGFAKGDLQAEVFEDVPKALRQWHLAGIKVYIYSSGSREAQKLIFGNTQHGDLRPFLYGYFDTAIGHKRESRSYKEIYLSLGVDEPSQIVFITDVLQEAAAAEQAGLQAVISLRPGNAPLQVHHNFLTITSLLDI